MIDVRRPHGPPLRIGHRGAAALAPENTIASFERAVAEGVDLVEFDVLRLADGELVIAHSDDLREVTHGRTRGRVGESSLEELRRAAPRLPTFDEALAFFAERATSVGLHLDVKLNGYERAVLDAIERHGLSERSLVTSFFPDSLRTFGRLEPALPTGLSYPLARSGLAQSRPLAPAVLAAAFALRRALPYRIDALLDRASATVASLHYLVVSPAVIERCHRRGVAVLVWTVDAPRAAARLARWGVDGIVTNDPRILATLMP